MEKIKYKFTSAELLDFMNILELTIYNTENIKLKKDFNAKLQQIILQKLYKRIRAKWEMGLTKNNFSFKHDEAIALFCYFGIKTDNPSSIRNTLNQINQLIHQKYS